MNPENLLEAFPQVVSFYHLGTVNASAPSTTLTLTASELSEKVGLLFRFLGDFSGSFLFLFDKGLDLSIYSELGNVLASQIATHLSENHERDILISPPHTLTHTQLVTLLKSSQPRFQQTYFHKHEKNLATIHTFMLPRNSQEEIGNA
jgi:hypothetical protein